MPGITGPRLLRLYSDLMDRYGPQGWWPADSEFEIAMGAVLVQRTRWRNARVALDNLATAGLTDIRAIRSHAVADLEKLIVPAGFYRQKAERLKCLCDWIADEGGFEAMHLVDTAALRSRLLEVRGIGPETADCVLLYALGRPLFVADAYARRLFQRLGWSGTLAAGDYESLRRRTQGELEEQAAFFNEFHALIVRHGKVVCRSTPECERCDIQSACATGRTVRAGRR